MLSLLFRFNGDTTPMARSLRNFQGEANKHGGEVGKAFGQQFKSAVLRYIGAGAILSTATKVIKDAAKIEADAMKEGLGVEAFQELQRAAELTGMTVEELRQAAPQVANEFIRLMEAVRQSGGFLDEQTVRELSDAADQLNEFVRSLAPVVNAALKAFNFVQRIGQADMERTAGNVFAAFGRLTGQGEYVQAGRELQSGAIETALGTGRGVQRTQARQAAQELVAGIQARRQAQAALGAGLTSAAPAIEAAGRLLPFGSEVTKQIADELKKANSQLSKLNSTVDAKL